MSERVSWLTWANGVTFVRLLLAPAFALSVAEGEPLQATVIFWLAVATDVADGRIARHFEEVSRHGRLIDHAADAIFVTTGAAILAWVGELPFALAPLIAAAFLQYAFGSQATGDGQPRRSRLGHWNGIAYYVIVATPVIRDTLGFSWPGTFLVQAVGWGLVASTLVSIGSRLRAAPRPK